MSTRRLEHQLVQLPRLLELSRSDLSLSLRTTPSTTSLRYTLISQLAAYRSRLAIEMFALER